MGRSHLNRAVVQPLRRHCISLRGSPLLTEVYCEGITEFLSLGDQHMAGRFLLYLLRMLGLSTADFVIHQTRLVAPQGTGCRRLLWNSLGIARARI